MSTLPCSLDLQAQLGNKLAEFEIVALQKCRELLRRARLRFEPAERKRGLIVRIGNYFGDVVVQLPEDGGRRARGGENREPDAVVDAGKALLCEGRHIRQAVDPSRGGQGKAQDRTPLDVRHGGE